MNETPKPIFPARHRDNEPDLYSPTAPVNPRLRYPIYTRFEAGHPRHFTREQKAIALDRQGYVCPICEQSIGMEGQCHHMVRWDLGGSSSLDNMVVVHKECHPMADARGLANGDMIVAGSIYDAEPSQIRSSSRHQAVVDHLPGLGNKV